MKNLRTAYVLLAAFVMVMASGAIYNAAYAQLEEPEVVKIPDPQTPLSEGYHTTIGFDVMLNNFGFGVGTFQPHAGRIYRVHFSDRDYRHTGR